MLGLLRHSLSAASCSTLEEEDGLVNIDEKRPLLAQDIDDASYLPLHFSLPSTHSKFEDHEDEESWQDRNRAIVSSVLRWLIIMCLLGIFFQLGNKAGLLPLNGGAAMDMRIVWNVQSVPQAARDQRLVPWWKLATVTLKVDVDIVAGKGKYVEVVADTTWANRPFILREARVASDVDRSSVMRRRRFAAADRF